MVTTIFATMSLLKQRCAYLLIGIATMMSLPQVPVAAASGIEIDPEAKWQLDAIEAFAPTMQHLIDQKILYDTKAITKIARKQNPGFDMASQEAQEKMLGDAYSKHWRKIVVDCLLKEVYNAEVRSILLFTGAAGLTMAACVFKAWSAYDNTIITWRHGAICSIAAIFLTYACNALYYLFIIYQNKYINSLALYYRLVTWPDYYIKHRQLEELERYYISKKEKLPEKVVTYVEESLKHCYSYPGETVSLQLKNHLRMVISMAMKPRYTALKVDHKLLAARTKYYKLDLQKQIKDLVFILQQASKTASNGKVQRVIVLLAGIPGTGKTYLTKTLAEVCGLPSFIETNLEDNPQLLFGTTDQPGRLTQARLACGGHINANIMVVINDADRALKVRESAIYLHILDKKQLIYKDPYLQDTAGITCFLPVINILTVNKKPKDGDAIFDRLNTIIDFDDPFTAEGFQKLGQDYFQKLIDQYAGEEDAPTWDDFTSQERGELDTIISNLKRQKKSVRQLENALQDYYMRKWQRMQGM